MGLTTVEKNTIEQEIFRLWELYRRVKTYLIASEKVSGGNRLSTPAMNELRNAFDHQMRVASVMYSNKDAVPQDENMAAFEYCKKNLSKAIGHVYRAGYDALDIISMALLEDIERIRKGVSTNTIVKVFPNYPTEIRLPIEKAMKDCDKAKANKDVEEDGSINPYFVLYEEAIGVLEEIKSKLNQRLPELQLVEEEERNNYLLQSKSAISQRNLAIQLGVVGVILSGIISGYASWYFSSPSVSPKRPINTTQPFHLSPIPQTQPLSELH